MSTAQPDKCLFGLVKFDSPQPRSNSLQPSSQNPDVNHRQQRSQKLSIQTLFQPGSMFGLFFKRKIRFTPVITSCQMITCHFVLSCLFLFFNLRSLWLNPEQPVWLFSRWMKRMTCAWNEKRQVEVKNKTKIQRMTPRATGRNPKTSRELENGIKKQTAQQRKNGNTRSHRKREVKRELPSVILLLLGCNIDHRLSDIRLGTDQLNYFAPLKRSLTHWLGSSALIHNAVGCFLPLFIFLLIYIALLCRICLINNDN